METVRYYKESYAVDTVASLLSLQLLCGNARPAPWCVLPCNAAYSEVPYPSAEGVKTLLDDIAPRTPKAATAHPKSFVDMSFVQELETSGFIKQLYKR